MKDSDLIRNINPFGLRMQPSLREKVEAAAKASHRSLNAEIVARLEASFAEPSKPDQTGSPVELLLSAREVIERLADLVEQQASCQPKE